MSQQPTRLTMRAPRRRLFAGLAAATVLTTAALTSGTLVASAATGDTSAATGQYLSGSLLGTNLDLLLSLGGEAATSDGVTPQVSANNLDLGALGIVNLVVPGGLAVPLNLADAGVVSQYASAANDGSSVGASGLVAADGSVGTGVVAPVGVAPGPLSLNLSQTVGSLGLNPSVLNQIANLNLAVGVTSARAAQAAPAVPVGSYDIASANIAFTSPAVGTVTAGLNRVVANLQTTVNALGGADGQVATALRTLSVGVPVDVAVAVDSSGLATAVAGLTSGTLSNPEFPGVTIDLDTGIVTVDLAALTGLNGRPANTELITAANLTTISTNVTGLLGALTTTVEDALTMALDGVVITASFGTPTVGPTPGVQLLGIATTVVALRSGDLGGITLLNGAVVPGGIPAVGALLTPLVENLGVGIADVSTIVVGPALAALVPAITPVLGGALRLTVNNQSQALGSGFSETALIVTVLPAVNPALRLRIANATVGVNAVDGVPGVSNLLSLNPDHGSLTGGTVVTITGTGLTGSTGATFDGTAGTDYGVAADGLSATVTTPAHAIGLVDTIVQSPAGPSNALGYTFDPDGVTPAPALLSLDPNHGPLTGGTVVTITGTGLIGSTGAIFGGTPGTTYILAADGLSATVTAPAHTVGHVNVFVQSPDGTSNGLSYTFDPAVGPPVAVATGLSPDHGPLTGGTVVTITGTGLTDSTGATFGGTAGTGYTVNSDTTATVTSPPHAVGPVAVIVSLAAGASEPLAYAYTPLATVTGISPPSGAVSGGTTVRITGACFTGASGVLFGTQLGTSFTVVDDSTITVVSPPGAGSAKVTVIGAVDCGNATVGDGFRYATATAAGLAFTGATPWSAFLVGLMLLLGGLGLVGMRQAARSVRR